MKTNQRLLVPIVGCFTSALILSGCGASFSIGEKSIAKAKIESEVARQLAERANRPEPDITCPGSLKAAVGATLECILVAQGETARYPVTITVTAVEGTDTTYDIEVADSPLE